MVTATLAPADLDRAFAGMTTQGLNELLDVLLACKPRTPEMRVNVHAIDCELLKRERVQALLAYQLALTGMDIEKLHSEERYWEGEPPSPCRAERLHLIDCELESRLAVAHAHGQALVDNLARQLPDEPGLATAAQLGAIQLPKRVPR